MALLTRTYTFTDGTTAYGSQVETEIANVVNTLNSLDAGSTTWTNVKVTTLSPQGDVNAGGHKITNLSAPTTSGDSAVYPITASQISAGTITNTQLTAQTIRGTTANSGGSAQEISQGTISTPDLRTNAVTLSSNVSATSNSTALGTTDDTRTITTIGKPVLILATVRGSVASNGATCNLQVCVTMDGSAITPHNFESMTVNGTSTSSLIVPIHIYHTPAAGAHTYTLSHGGNTGSISSVVYDFTVIELRA